MSTKNPHFKGIYLELLKNIVRTNRRDSNICSYSVQTFQFGHELIRTRFRESVTHSRNIRIFNYLLATKRCVEPPQRLAATMSVLKISSTYTFCRLSNWIDLAPRRCGLNIAITVDTGVRRHVFTSGARYCACKLPKIRPCNTLHLAQRRCDIGPLRSVHRA